MALTLTRQYGPWSNGPIREVMYTCLFDSSYPNNGESLTPANVGLSEIFHVDIDPIDETAGALLYNYDYANQKILVFFPSGGAQSAPTTLAAPAVAIASGSTAVTSTSANPTPTVTPGIAKEVGATIDLSTVTVRLTIKGL